MKERASRMRVMIERRMVMERDGQMIVSDDEERGRESARRMR